jgi:hypothetical protein
MGTSWQQTFWGGLPKSSDDTQTIQQAIDAIDGVTLPIDLSDIAQSGANPDQFPMWVDGSGWTPTTVFIPDVSGLVNFSAYEIAQGILVSDWIEALGIDSLLDAKQNTLVSGTNIKTINGNSVLGSGNLSISGGGSTNASDLTSGTLADARLSSNVPLRNAANTFTANQTVTGNLTASGSLSIGTSAQFTEQTFTPTGTTQTIDLNAGNLSRLSLGSTTGNVTLTLTVPTTAASGRVTIIQHATTPRGITIAVSSGTIVWFTAIPAWSSQAVGRRTNLFWTRSGTEMHLSAVGES